MLHRIVLLLFAVLLWPACAFSDVRVSGFVDFSFGTWSGSSGVQLSDNLCVYNSNTKKVLVTGTGSGGGGSFKLFDGSNTVDYQVRFGSLSRTYLLTPGVARNYVGADKKKENCGGRDNSKLEVILTLAALDAARPGNYSGTLTILVEPN